MRLIMQFVTLVRAVPRVGSWGPQVTTAVVTAAWVLGLSPRGVDVRVRLGAAAVAATGCFLLDDAAAHTLAGVPLTRLARRTARFVVATAVTVAWLVVVEFGAAFRFETRMPTAAALLEVATIALIATAVSVLAMRRSDDERGGLPGTVTALATVAMIYLPMSPNWMVLTPQPRAGRLCVVSAAAVLVALAASLDPAVRLRRTA